MGYTVQLSRIKDQRVTNTPTLVDADASTKKSFKRLAAKVSAQLQLLLLNNSKTLDLFDIVSSSIKSPAVSQQLLEWRISLDIRLLQTLTPLWAVEWARGTNRIKFIKKRPNPTPQCSSCLGEGHIPDIKLAGSPTMAAPSPASPPKDLRMANKKIQNGIDELRGRGVFDALIKECESSLIKHLLPLADFRIQIGSIFSLPGENLHSSTAAIILPPILQLGPDRFVSSRWEAARQTKRKYENSPGFNPICPTCKGNGIALNS